MSTRSIVAWSLAATPLVVALGLSLSDTRAIDSSKLPPEGFRVADPITAVLPNGGTVLVLSSVCQTCRDRASAFARHVARHEDKGLVVFETEADSGSSLVRVRVSPHPRAIQRTVFLPYADMPQLIGGEIVPMAVEIDASQQVRSASASSIGWLGAALNPANWLRGWVRLFQRTFRSSSSDPRAGAPSPP